jgi:hypothetical protein
MKIFPNIHQKGELMSKPKKKNQKIKVESKLSEAEHANSFDDQDPKIHFSQVVDNGAGIDVHKKVVGRSRC